jgi:holin-like protein
MVGLFKLFLYLSLGEIVVHIVHLPLPGPMIGLVLMLFDFRLNRRIDPDVEQLFDRVSSHFAILFVPAGAGVVAHGAVLGSGISFVVISVLAGTLATLMATAFSFRLFLPQSGGPSQDRSEAADPSRSGSRL